MTFYLMFANTWHMLLWPTSK